MEIQDVISLLFDRYIVFFFANQTGQNLPRTGLSENLTLLYLKTRNLDQGQGKQGISRSRPCGAPHK